jgi:hypothetical protein
MRYPLHRSLALRVTSLSICLLVTLVCAAGVLAQTQITSGTIQGTVVDANGAAVPGAGVQVRNIGTNLVRDLITDEDGRFVALQLPSGRYTVTVSKQGFATLVVEKADLTVGQALNLPLSMKVSSLQETVTITSTPTVDTVKTESSSTIDETTVNTTPILGRKFEDLLTLTPGVSVVQGPDGDEITFAGQRGVFNNVSLDGGDYNNGFFGEQLGGQRAAIDITLEAVKEFQVVATGASAEFGRTAGGIINVISKSGSNDIHGSLFHFQRLEALAAHTSDGKPLKDFRREQLGGTVGGPIRRDKAFFFFAFEGIRERLTRANLSEPIGPTPCPVAAPVITANEALINTNSDCQRLALINFVSATSGLNEGSPVSHPIRNYAFLGKLDFNLNRANQLAISYNMDYSKNTNQTFDVPTYGASANGIEGLSKIHNVNFNLFTTVSPTKINEAHFSYTREERPRKATPSSLAADTGAGGGFDPSELSFRFGNPFFLQPNVDELLWRTHVKDNFSIISGSHNIKFGGEWVHTLNSQVFRGFFTGRYLFNTVSGFLRYAASPALGAGFGPDAGQCADGSWTTISPAACGGAGATTPLLLFLQGAGPSGPATDAAGASTIKNEDYALFAQDKWQIRPNFTLSYGLRWEAQIFPEVTVPPSQTAYGFALSDPRFPSDGTLHSPKKEFQPRVGFAWDISKKGKSVLRASYGIFYGRQNMLSQVGSITTNGVQQQTIAGGLFANPTVRPTWPGLVTPTASSCLGNPFPCFSGVRVFSKDYANPRIYTINAQFEQEIATDFSLYFDYTHAQGVHLTRFLNLGRTGIFAIRLGDIFVTSALGKSLYNGFTVGMRKRFSRGYQMEWNYVLSKDKDDDSNERDPFTDRSFDLNNLQLDYALSDRDIRHKFNFITFAQLPAGLEGNFRVQARSAQPITPAVRTATNRNSLRKDNNYFSFDWRLQRPFRFGSDGHYALIPIVEMFNTFNNKNLINPLSTAALFNFDGFLRQGVGDPRQLQLALKFTF